MHIITGRNVNTVYAQAVNLVRTKGVLQPSRGGDVLAVPEPVVLVTERPQERVLLDPRRDANPFFHFFEALWMLAGRRDATFLNRFVRDFSERFAEDDGDQWGAYGYRWRQHFDNTQSYTQKALDQLDYVVRRLRADPLDRRVVIAMWDPNHDVEMDTRDLPCNTHIYPRIVNGALDLMVCCRSNDVVWGACGANAVHFAFLQEYLAGRIGVGVGTLRQMTTNLHGYTGTLAKVKEPIKLDPYQDSLWKIENLGIPGAAPEQDIVSHIPIGTDWDHWDEDLQAFLMVVETDVDVAGMYEWENSWFRRTATNMWLAHASWRLGHPPNIYMGFAGAIEASDWRLAATQWLKRKAEKKP